MQYTIWVKLRSRALSVKDVVISGCHEKMRCQKYAQNVRVHTGTHYGNQIPKDTIFRLKKSGSGCNLTEVKAYACKNCGHAFTADDVHIVAISEQRKKGDSIEVPYECDNCHIRNIVYWDVKHERFEDDFNRINVASE